MTISNRDTKILWGRAAAMCSFPGCRLDLVPEPEGSSDPALIGEMAHIIAETPDGPRGKSLLTEDQRNSYANLILLCPTHHALIDDKTQVDKYPVELLHEWKSLHEQWVRQNRVSGQMDNWQDEQYAYLIDRITKILNLEKWNTIGESLVRDMVPMQFSDAQAYLNGLFLGAVWPGIHPRIEEVIKGVVKSYNAYMENFREHADVDGSGNYLCADHSYYQVNSGDIYRISKEEEKEKLWSRKNGELLCKLVVSLNEFGDAIRAELNPRYLLEHGRFLLVDSLGYRGGTSQIILPGRKYNNRLANEASMHHPRTPKHLP